uniref:Uncharacterized protein n=1 Tax=Pseudomonas phage HRDY3 TaxID=3236930 RepID=A0AB39CEH9_9VIRU
MNRVGLWLIVVLMPSLMLALLGCAVMIVKLALQQFTWMNEHAMNWHALGFSVLGLFGVFISISLLRDGILLSKTAFNDIRALKG